MMFKPFPLSHAKAMIISCQRTYRVQYSSGFKGDKVSFHKLLHATNGFDRSKKAAHGTVPLVIIGPQRETSMVTRDIVIG